MSPQTTEPPRCVWAGQVKEMGHGDPPECSPALSSRPAGARPVSLGARVWPEGSGIRVRLLQHCLCHRGPSPSGDNWAVIPESPLRGAAPSAGARWGFPEVLCTPRHAGQGGQPVLAALGMPDGDEALDHVGVSTERGAEQLEGTHLGFLLGQRPEGDFGRKARRGRRAPVHCPGAQNHAGLFPCHPCDVTWIPFLWLRMGGWLRA